MGIALILIGTLAIIVGPIAVIVNAIRKRSVKPWAIVAGSGILLIILGSIIIPKTEFVVNSLTITPEEVVVREEATVTANIENTGEVEGTYNATLIVNNKKVETKDVLLGAGLNQNISFQIAEDEPGIYEIKLGKLIDTLKVLEAPQFQVDFLTVMPQEVAAGEEATVTVNIQNTRATEGTYHATLLVNNKVVEARDISLAAREGQTISFRITEDVPGIYKVEVGELACTLKVLKPAEFELISLGVNPKVIKVGEEATVTVNLKNRGEAGGTYSLSLSIDGEVIETRDVTLAGGGTKPVTFSISQDLPGTYSIEIGGLAGSLKVIQPVRLPTGTYVLGKPGQSYTGDLKVENGLNLDAVVVLTKTTEPNNPLKAVYIQSQDSYTIRRVGSGNYHVYFACGMDWDEESKEFTRDKIYKAFEDEFNFSIYNYEVTLHGVIGGTAGTEYLDEDEFPELP